MNDHRMRRVWGLTWMGWINVFLQFTCFRLHRVVEQDGTITGIRLRWSPIWRTGWSLPTRTPSPPGHSNPKTMPPGVDYRFEDGKLTTRIDRSWSRHRFVVTRSMQLGADLHCAELDFEPPEVSWWRWFLEAFGWPEQRTTLTLNGYALNVAGELSVPPWGRIQSHYPPTFWQRLRAAFGRRRRVELDPGARPGHAVVMQRGTLRVRVEDKVVAGDPIAVGPDGLFRRGVSRQEAVGTYVTGAPAGGMVMITLPEPPVSDGILVHVVDEEGDS